MPQTALILGASGKFGGAAAHAFEAAGWHVLRFNRGADDLHVSVQRADVVVNAWNPPDYTHWAREMRPLHQRVIDAAKGADVTVIVPGNVYVFGPQTPGPWSETSPHAAQNELGRLRIEMEAAYRASGVRTILLRAGDFLDTSPSGNWFDAAMIKGIAKGRLTYPGRMDAAHSWAYLPDIARAAVQLAETRAELPTYADIPFAGYTLTGAELAGALEEVTGRRLKVSAMPWWVLGIAQVLAPNFRYLRQMRYLWDTPHALDATRLGTLLPGFRPTPLHAALRRGIAHTGAAVSAPGEIEPHKAVSVQG